jgi:DNA-binding NtrC family response regulator
MLARFVRQRHHAHRRLRAGGARRDDEPAPRAAHRDGEPPRSGPRRGSSAAQPQQAAPPEVLVVVDDDEFMLDMLPRRLRRFFPESDATKILIASTPEEALRLTRENADARLVIVSDFDLRATMTGIDVLREAERIAPRSTRILFSGHTPNEVGPTDGRIVHAFLEKPLRLDDLLPALLAAIAQGAPTQGQDP